MESYSELPEEVKDTNEVYESMLSESLVPVSYGQLPDAVKDHFEIQSEKYINPDFYQKNNFSSLLQSYKKNGDVKYFAQQDKLYDTNGETERLTYIVDTRDDEITGYIELRLGVSDDSAFYIDKPFVGMTRTSEEFLREGLGVTRLEDANVYSIAEHGHVLNSDSVMTDKPGKFGRS